MPWLEILDESQKGIANGVASLNENAKIPFEQLPQLTYIHKATYQYSDLEKGVAKTVINFAANMVVWGIYIYVKVAFNDSGNDLLDVGLSDDQDYFVSNVDISTTGKKDVDDAEYPFFVTTTNEITLTYNCDNDDSDTGVLEIFIRYSEH